NRLKLRPSAHAASATGSNRIANRFAKLPNRGSSFLPVEPMRRVTAFGSVLDPPTPKRKLHFPKEYRPDAIGVAWAGLLPARDVGRNRLADRRQPCLAGCFTRLAATVAELCTLPVVVFARLLWCRA